MPYAKPNTQQTTLFGEIEAWSAEWEGMPAFEQKNLLPNYSVRVNFATFPDLQKFAALIGQHLTEKTSSVWFPQQQKLQQARLKYVPDA
jgi:hypothetical protein